jgi:hypothetical protein
MDEGMWNPHAFSIADRAVSAMPGFFLASFLALSNHLLFE